MTHSDPDFVAMLALGETDLPADEVQHILTCAACSAELERLKRVTRAARENGPLDLQLEDPSPLVWERIHQELFAGASDRAEPSAVQPRYPRRRSRRPALAWAAASVAAVLVIVAGVVGTIGLIRSTPPVEATAALTALPAWAGSHGEATMRRDSGGGAELTITLSSPAVSKNVGTYREVWLMNRQLTKLISVGVLDGGTGSFRMPAGIVAADYPIVDISEEAADGNPAHSGDSIVRGTLARQGRHRSL